MPIEDFRQGQRAPEVGERHLKRAREILGGHGGSLDDSSIEKLARDIALALHEEQRRCALVAQAHHGSAALRRLRRGFALSDFDSAGKLEIMAEERGEDVAANIISKAIMTEPAA